MDGRMRQWNQQHCIPPLPEKEFIDIWKWIVDCHRQNRDEQHERREEERRRQKTSENEALRKL